MARTESVDLVEDEVVTNVAIAAVLAALTGALAQVSIPIPGLPAPISFQVFGVYFAGLLLGPVWGGFSVGLYLLVGLAGAPVFSNGGAGIGYATGPTGGYLAGFLLAAVLIGAIVHRGVDARSLETVPIPLQAGALVAGLAVVYALGIAWLIVGAGAAVEDAVWAGMLVFLPGDAIKIAATLALVRGGVLARKQSDLPA